MSAIRPYGPPSTPLDSREKLEADVRDYFSHWIGGTSRTQEAIKSWLDRQAAITEREWKEQCAADECCGFQELVDINTQVQAKVDELTEERDRLLRQVELKDDIIEGLRQSLDEIMAERNALVHCLEADHDLKASWDGLRKAWNIEVTDEYIDAWDALSHAFDRACAYIADKMGTCPKDAEDYDRDCGSICHDQLAECWRHYFEHTQHDTVESLLDEFMVALHELGEGADYGPTKERMAERIRKAVHDG